MVKFTASLQDSHYTTQPVFTFSREWLNPYHSIINHRVITPIPKLKGLIEHTELKTLVLRKESHKFLVIGWYMSDQAELILMQLFPDLNLIEKTDVLRRSLAVHDLFILS